MATTAATAENKIKDLLLGQDVAGQVELLLNLLSDAAAGKELSNVLSEVIQVTIAGGVGHPAVKKLAYDLCKAVPLAPSDYSLLVDGIKNDISCGVPEGQVLALCFLPHLPADYLIQLLEKGEIANFVAPHTRNVVPSVRCTATSALAAVLLVPGVQAVMGSSADTAASCSDWWDAVVDSVGDSLPDVVVAGLAGANALYQAAAAAASSSSSGGGGGSNAACVAAAQRATLRLAAGIGPLMDTWRMLPSNAQVPVIQLLGHVWTTLLDTDSSSVAAVPAAAGGGFGGSGAAASAAGVDDLPAAALPGMLAYLSGALSSLNPAVKLEAARVILRASRLARRGPAGGSSGSSSSSSSSSGGQPLSRLRLVGEVPPSTSAAAIEALLELKGRLLVEAALEEVVSLMAAHLEVLQVPTRLLVLGRLWPLIALLQSPTDRLTAFAHAWQAALALALDSAAAAAQGQDPPGGTAATLSGILSDPFLEDIIAEKSPAHSGPFWAGAGAGGANSSSSTAAAAAGGPAAAGATGGSFTGAAAGPTGGSVMSGGGGAGDDTFSDGGGSFTGGSVVTKSRSKRMMASAKGLVTSGAALAGNMGSSLAAAATATLTNLPRLLWDTPPPAKAQLPATLKQELVCTLLSVLSQHPAAAAALQLPPGKPVPPPAPSPAAAAAAAAAGTSSRPLSRLQSGQPQQQQQQQQQPGAAAVASPTAVPNGDVPAAAAGLLPPPSADGAAPAAADGVVAAAAAAAQSPQQQQQQQQQQQARPQFGLDDVSTSPIVASLQSQVVMWLGAAVSALAATRACLQWEPLVVPPMPGQPPTPPLPPMASVNLTTVPVDSWLQLLQAACHAVRSVTRLHGYYSLKAIYRSNGGRMLPQLSPWDLNGALARTCEAAGAALQQLLTRELAEWKGLALAVRPRVLWVAAHYLELPSLLDDTWSVLLGCVEDAVCRGDKQEGDGRTRQLAASARDGLLLKRFAAPQLNMGRDKAGAHTSFDAAAASALVEMHEYKSDALQVGLTVLQYLVWVVQAAIAATQGGTGAPPGPAEESLARKLLELVRAAALSDAAGVDVRDWCKRMAHTLGAILDPLESGSSHTAAGAAAAAAGGPAFAILPPAAAVSGPGAKAAQLPGGYNPVAGFSALGFGGGSSSDEGSEDEGEVRRMTREQRLARKLGLGGGRKKGGRRTAAAAAGGSSSSDDEDAAGGSSSSSSSSDGSSSDGSSAAAGNDDSSSGDESLSPAGHAAAGGSDSDGDEAGAAAVGTNPFSAGGAAAAAAAATAAAAAGGDGSSRSRGRKHTADASKSAAKAAKKAARAAKKAAVARAKADSVAVGAAESASGVWGYPFGGPRSQTLFISRRSRRHRLFKWHLALAMANLHDDDLAGGLGGGGGAAAAAAAAVRSGGYGGGFAGGLFGTAAGSSGSNGSNGGSNGGTMAAAGLTDATGPVFSGESGFRLDQPGFWNSLHGGIESGWVDLSGPADPLVLSGRYSTTGGAGSAGGSITVTLRAFNRLPLDLEEVEVLLRLVGPVKAERRETSWNLPPLMPTEAAQHTFSLTPTGYGRLEVHARLLLPLPQLPSEMAVSGAPSLACQPLVVDMARLLRPPECPPPNAQEVLALWSSLPVQVELSATALWPGVDGLLLLLSALARQPMYCAWCHMLPVVCGAQAAFVANPTTHTADSIVVMMVAQLMPDEAAAAEAAAAAAAAAEAAAAAAATAAAADAAAAAAAAGDAASDTAEEVLPGKAGMGGGQQQQDKQAAPKEGAAADADADSGGAAQPMPMRCVVQLLVRSSSHEVLLAIQQQPEAWVEDISQGTLCCGVSSRLTPLPHQGKPLLHPLVARLEQQLSSAALLGPPPPPVPPLERPLPPRFRRKLAAKADEEDSDAEDTELELTAEEWQEQARALEKHKEACEKAEERHAAAKASRAAAVLRASALAEWRRTACPPLFMG